MSWLIFVLGFLLAIAGGASVVHGYPYIQIEFGWTEVIAGTVALAGGVVTFSLGAVLWSLARLRASVEGAGARASGGSPELAFDPPALAVPAASVIEPPLPGVVGRYESGGASYVLYSDGSIDVEGGSGRRRFASMDALKIFMAGEEQDTLVPRPLQNAGLQG